MTAAHATIAAVGFMLPMIKARMMTEINRMLYEGFEFTETVSITFWLGFGTEMFGRGIFNLS